MKKQAETPPEEASEETQADEREEGAASTVEGGPSPEAGSSERGGEGGDASREVALGPERSPIARALLALFGMTIAACIGVIALKVLARFDVRALWDDAYMFQRYAHHLLHEGRISWNSGGPPIYGLTSLGFLIVNVPLLLATRGNLSLSAMLSSLLPGVALLGLLAWLAREAASRSAAQAGSPDRNARPARGWRAWTAAPALVAIGLVFVCLARSTFSDHFVSGMDTTFGMCFGASYVLVAMRLSAAPSSRLAWALGALGGMSFAIRPELAMVAVFVPLSFVVFARSRDERRAGLVALGVTLAVLGAHLAICRLYFGTPLPLPFWVKGTSHYGAGFEREYRGDNTKLLIPWLGSFWPLFVPTAVEVLSSPRKFWRDAPAIDKALVVAVVLLLGYTWLVITQIMAQSQRFYYPLVPLLAYLASSSIGRFFALAAPSSARAPGPSPAAALAAAGALVLALSDLAPVFTTGGKDLLSTALGGAFGRQDRHRPRGAQRAAVRARPILGRYALFGLEPRPHLHAPPRLRGDDRGHPAPPRARGLRRVLEGPDRGELVRDRDQEEQQALQGDGRHREEHAQGLRAQAVRVATGFSRRATTARSAHIDESCHRWATAPS